MVGGVQRASERGDLGPVPVRGRSLNAPRARPTHRLPLQLVCDPMITCNLNLDAGILIVESNVTHNPDSRCPIGSISKIRHCFHYTTPIKVYLQLTAFHYNNFSVFSGRSHCNYVQYLNLFIIVMHFRFILHVYQ